MLFVLDQCQALTLAQCRLIAGSRLREPAGCQHRPSRLSDKRNTFSLILLTGMAGEVRVEKRQRNADSQRFDRSAWTRWEHRQPNAHAGHVLAHILLSRVFRRSPGSSCVRPLRLSGRSLPIAGKCARIRGRRGCIIPRSAPASRVRRTARKRMQDSVVVIAPYPRSRMGAHAVTHRTCEQASCRGSRSAARCRTLLATGIA